MAQRSILIIGAGLAGLSAGCYAQRNGYHSHILEHHALPGGVVTGWKRGDYLIDGGIHFLMGHRPGQPLYDLYHELGVTKSNSFVDMPLYGRFIDEAGSGYVDIVPDLNQLADRLKQLSPADAPIVDEFIAGAYAMSRVSLWEMGMSRPPELTTTFSKLRLFWGIRHVLRYFGGRYIQSVADYVQQIQHPWLRDMVLNLFLPEIPVWFIFLLLSLLNQRQMGLLADGSLAFSSAIEQHYHALGGKTTYHATVEAILVQNDRAVGVRLKDGSEHFADVIVSAADGYQTIFEMLKGRYINKQIKDRYQRWKPVRPFLMASFGVNRDLCNEPWMQSIKLASPFDVGECSIEWLTLRIFNYSSRFSPPGKTVVQVNFDTEWDHWHKLHPERPRYESEKRRVAAEVLARLEQHYPGIANQVEVTDVATPYTTWRYTLNRQGAYQGWLPSPETMRTPVGRVLPGLKNFYMAGQWVMPGGGVAPCLYSGRHVVQILCHEDGRAFS